MPTELIFCPACNHKLRLPEDLMGQPVQCPKCNETFTAPPPAVRSARAPDEPVAASESIPVGPSRGRVDDWTSLQEGPSRAPDVSPPGICLIVVGTLGTLASLLRVVMAAAFPKQMQQLFANHPMLPKQPNIDMTTVDLILGCLFLAFSLTTIAGGVSMLGRRTHWLAVLGSITAMVNINLCCCALGIPAGIYAMTVLFNPQVKASFK